MSEGIGYGMLIAVYMADKTLFDELWGYAKANFDGHSLMNWNIDATGAVDGAEEVAMLPAGEGAAELAVGEVAVPGEVDDLSLP